MKTKVFTTALWILFAIGCSTEDDPNPTEDITKEDLGLAFEESARLNSNVPGSIALVDIPGVLEWTETSGNASLEENKSMDIGHQFVSASVTKMLVATVVLQLYEEGLLSLESPVSNWIDNELLTELTMGNDVLNIRHLLNHTSGIFDYLDDGSLHLEVFQSNPSKRYSHLERVMAAIDRGSPVSEIGSQFHYSNTNYVLLGLIIESLTNETLEHNFQTRIFSPLGMQQSHVANDAKNLNLAHGYFQSFNVTDFSLNFNYGSPDGGLVTTVNDLHLFAKALFNAELFNDSQTLDLMLGNNGFDYGLGVRVFNTEGTIGNVWGHDGSDPGYFCYLVYAEKKRSVIIYAGNRAEIEVDQPAYFINQVLQQL